MSGLLAAASPETGAPVPRRGSEDRAPIFAAISGSPSVDAIYNQDLSDNIGRESANTRRWTALRFA